MAETNRGLLRLRDWAALKAQTDVDVAARPLWAQIASEVGDYLKPVATPAGPALFETPETT